MGALTLFILQSSQVLEHIEGLPLIAALVSYG